MFCAFYTRDYCAFCTLLARETQITMSSPTSTTHTNIEHDKLEGKEERKGKKKKKKPLVCASTVSSLHCTLQTHNTGAKAKELISPFAVPKWINFISSCVSAPPGVKISEANIPLHVRKESPQMKSFFKTVFNLVITYQSSMVSGNPTRHID